MSSGECIALNDTPALMWQAVFKALPKKTHYKPVNAAQRIPLFWSVHESPIGPVVALIAYLDSDQTPHLTGLAPLMGRGDEDVLTAKAVWHRRFPRMCRASDADVQQTESLLTSLFNGERVGSITLFGTPFEHQVWRALLDTPVGGLVSYKDIARATQKPQGARAVGGAVGRNPIFFLIPCHRVIASDGTIGGYGWGLPEKRRLLRLEGLSTQPASQPTTKRPNV